MDFLQHITVISPVGEKTDFDNAYIYDDNELSQTHGIFSPSGKHIAIIPINECSVSTGYTACYNGLHRTVTAVCDNTKRSKLMPHIRLTLE